MIGTPKHGFGSTFEILAHRGEILRAHFEGANAGLTAPNPYDKGTWGFEHFDAGQRAAIRTVRLMMEASAPPCSAGPIYRPPPEIKEPKEPVETLDEIDAKLDKLFAGPWKVKEKGK